MKVSTQVKKQHAIDFLRLNFDKFPKRTKGNKEVIGSIGLWFSSKNGSIKGRDFSIHGDEFRSGSIRGEEVKDKIYEAMEVW